LQPWQDGEATLNPTTSTIRLDAYKRNAAETFAGLRRVLPYSLAVREVVRMRALAESGALRTPLLDVGCGDGLFWEVMTQSYLTGGSDLLKGLMGIDLNAHELQLASLRLGERGGLFEIVDISENLKGHSMEGAFASVIANCSLEHVPRLQVALENIRTFLRPEGDFMLFVPAPLWTDTLALKRVARRASNRMAGTVGGLLDGFFQHHHLYPHYVWRHLLGGVGFSHVEIVGLGSRLTNRLFESYLAPAFGAFLYKTVFNRYPGFHPLQALSGHNQALFQEVTEGRFIHQDLTHPEIVEYYIRCRR